MKQIDLNHQQRVSLKLFPDNQPHVNVIDVNEGDEVEVSCALRSSLDMMHLLEVSNALDHLFAKKKVLVIPYLIAARFDRVMEDGDSCDLEVVAELINMCKFEKVVLYDVHSDVAKALIKNSVNISNKVLVDAYNKPDSILICPDAGAVKKVGKYLEWNKNIVDVVYCTKTRDLSNGKIDLKVLEPEKCTGKNCVIIDDLCDGGGTFVGIASQIKPAFLTLIVTHGIFSKGFKTLSEHDINHIITSDSYRFTNSNSFITTIPFTPCITK